jgi:hypothetical protein
LGDAIAPVFFDGARDDHSQLFPRIVARFQSVSGSISEMEAFLLESLGISREAQTAARDDVEGRTEEVSALTPPEPPAAVVVESHNDPTPATGDQLQEKFEQHKNDATQALNELLGNMKVGAGEDGRRHTHGRKGTSRNRGGLTREQEARGRRGEEEFLRRICLPGGWMGFKLVNDTRSQPVGYDFVCRQGEKEVKIEVKTFAKDGRVVMPSSELRAAAIHGDDYYLIGFIDDGDANQWQSVILGNPLPQLLQKGSFSIDVELQARARDVFVLGDDQ